MSNRSAHTPLLSALMLAALLLAAPGCGKDKDTPETASVTGSVTYKGKPVTEGTVQFHPQGMKGNPASGELGPNGRFTLTTYGKDDGAVIGHHIVTVQVIPEGALPGQEFPAGKYPIPKRYENPTTSDLVVEVKPGSNNFDLELKDKK